MGFDIGDLLAYSNPGQRDMALIISTLSLSLFLFFMSLCQSNQQPLTADIADLRLKKICPFCFQKVRNSESDNRTKYVFDKKELLSPPHTWPRIASSGRACQISCWRDLQILSEAIWWWLGPVPEVWVSSKLVDVDAEMRMVYCLKTF